MSIKDSIAIALGGVLKESLLSQIRIETLEDDHTIVTKDGTLMSLISLEGALISPGEAEMEVLVERLRIALSAYFSQPGHMLEVTFMRDAAAAKRQLERIVDRSKRAARGLKMDLDDVLDERVGHLSKRMVAESCLIAAYTRSNILTPEESKIEGMEVAKRMEGLPPLPKAMRKGKSLDSVVSRHHSLVETVVGALTGVGQICHALNAEEALQEIRAGLHPDTYSFREEWHPLLPGWTREHSEAVNPGKRALTMVPDTPGEMAGVDASFLGTPTFDRQLATMDSFVENSRTVRIGDMMFSGFDMTLAPEVLPEFNALVLDINAKGHDIPWRASLRLESGGMHAQRMKSLFLSIFSWASPSHNNRIRDTLNTLQELDGQGDAVVRLRMSFATWAPVGQGDTLRRNTQSVMGAVKRWGNCGVDGVSGDPMATVLSSAPGITTLSTAPVSSGPMRDVLALMPLGRQASPWEHGTLLLRTPSGKPWPFQPTSSKQTTWITLAVGTPGSGKSVFLNTVNFASVLSPSIAGGDDPVLPRIAIIDIGPSSAGLISLVQEALPAKKRHLAMFQRLKMSKEHAVNVFDTHLGMRRPTAADRQFIGNFVNLICSDGDTPPSSPMRGLIGASIDRAYETFGDEREPKRYLEGDDSRVDNALREAQFDRFDSASWWMVVDHLMATGFLYEAELAQRHAVPTLSDLVTASQAEQVRSLYGGAIDAETHQPLTESFQRMISEVVRDYPILAGTTRYSIGSARVVSMDLMEVTSRGASAQARKQTAMMYMLARQMMTRDFFLDEAEFRIAVRDGILPQVYLEHHVTRARDNAQVPKIICMDEFHRTGGNPAITDQVMQDGREGRKFNVDLRIASQLIEDFPTPIIEIASTLLVCNVGGENSIRVMDEMFGLSESEKRVLRFNLRGPSRRGAPVWAMFKLKGEGQVRQELNLTLGPVELWAYSTTAEDVALRNRLYESLGPRLARRVLAARYPGGSAKSDIETRIARLEELGERLDDDSRGDVIGNLVEELKAQAYAMTSGDAAA